MDWVLKQGGVEEMERRSISKSKKIYDIIDSSKGFYANGVAPEYRSRVNIPFRVGGPAGNADLEKAFLAQAEALGMKSLKGHRYKLMSILYTN
jgi:phosphoserine aminotransferase